MDFLGLDIGSTTAKAVLVRGGKVIYQKYDRHFSRVRERARELVEEVRQLIGGERIKVAVSGSAGLGLAEAADVPFVQEVFATSEVVKRMAPDTDCVIELGGEDAKIIFFDRRHGGAHERHLRRRHRRVYRPDGHASERDRGRTGRAQPAAHSSIYPIASRCGVFAKTRHPAPAESGRAQGGRGRQHFSGRGEPDHRGPGPGPRHSTERCCFWAGPLYFLQGPAPAVLSRRWSWTRNTPCFPEYGRFAVAMGAAMYAERNGLETDCDALIARFDKLQKRRWPAGGNADARCLKTRRSTRHFAARHAQNTTCPGERFRTYDGRGVSGHRLRQHHHQAGAHWPRTTRFCIPITPPTRATRWTSCRSSWSKIYALCGRPHPHCRQRRDGLRRGAHSAMPSAWIAALWKPSPTSPPRGTSSPDVDFILDIGGQDIKCFQHQKRRHRQHHAQRGLFLRLRLVYRDLRHVHGL